MLKAVKESMKNWLMSHERLYWYIVVGLAVLGFGIVTAVGCAKLEKANAAVFNPLDLSTLPNCTYQRYSQHLSSKHYLIVTKRYDSGSFVGYFYLFSSDVPEYYSDDSKGWILKYPYGCDIYQLDKGGAYWSGSTTNANSTQFEEKYSNQYVTGYYEIIGSNFPLPTELSQYPQRNVVGYYLHGLPTEYSASAPYLSFKQLLVNNKLNKGTVDNDVSGHLYSEYFASSAWMYVGKLNNISEQDLAYTLNVKFEIELPTREYVDGLVNEFGLNYTLDSAILRYNRELLSYWKNDGDADARKFQIEYSFDVTPDEHRNVSYTLTFAEWEYLLRASFDELNSEFEAYSPSWRAVMLSFMHVKKVTTEVITTRGDFSVYGGYTTNVFERSASFSDDFVNDCVDVYTGVDKNFVTSDMLDDMISTDLSKAEKEYMKELENRLDDLQNQIDDMYSVNDAFGNLEGSNLWVGFQNLAEGLGSLTPAIASLSVVVGSVLAFLPGASIAIISYTFFAICVIAIIKALRG